MPHLGRGRRLSSGSCMDLAQSAAWVARARSVSRNPAPTRAAAEPTVTEVTAFSTVQRTCKKSAPVFREFAEDPCPIIAAPLFANCRLRHLSRLQPRLSRKGCSPASNQLARYTWATTSEQSGTGLAFRTSTTRHSASWISTRSLVRLLAAKLTVPSRFPGHKSTAFPHCLSWHVDGTSNTRRGRCPVSHRTLLLPAAPHNPAELKESVKSSAALYIAAGIDPERSNIFVQSHVSAHAELSWLLTCSTPMGWLQRMIQASAHSVPHSLARSYTPSLTPSHIPSLTRSLHHSLAHSHTPPHIPSLPH